MSNPIKSIGKAVKKVFKTVTKVVKDNWKLIVAGAAIYFTGGALGWWQTPFTATAGGAAAGAGSGLAGGAAAGGAATTGAAVPLANAAGTASTLASKATLASVAPNTAGTLAAIGGGGGSVTTGVAVPLAGATGTASTIANASALASVAPNAAGTLAAAGGGGGSVTTGAGLWGGVKGAAKAMLGFVEKNPTAGLIAGNMLSSAFTPTAAEEQMKLEEWRRKNSSFFGVGGTQGVGAQGSDVSGLFNLRPREQQPTTAVAGTGRTASALAPELPGANANVGLIASRLRPAF
jgi:hypothetical protein